MRRKTKFFKQMEEEAEKHGRKSYLGGNEDELCIEKVKCEVCHEIIAKCDMANFDTPMRGSMFMTCDPKHGRPEPFHPSLFWEELRCPYCNKRPFLHREKFINEQNEWCGFPYACTCGKGYGKRQALMGHQKSCKEHKSWLKNNQQ
jgi:hypothetical protein